MGRYTSVTASRMTDAYGASTPVGVHHWSALPGSALLGYIRKAAPSATRKGSRIYVPADPRVIGAAPLDPWLRSGHPRGVHRRSALSDPLRLGRYGGTRSALSDSSDLSDPSDSSDKTARPFRLVR